MHASILAPLHQLTQKAYHMNATQHNHHAKNIYSWLDALNTATECRYAIRREDTNYVLVGPYGEYDAQPAWETVQRLVAMSQAATGRRKS